MSSPNRTNTLVYTSLLAAHVMLVWLLPYFPTQDGPCHIYNLVILHDLLHGGKEWGNYFAYTLHPVPNLGFNLLAYPLMNFLPPLAVERVFITIYIVLMGSSVPLLLKTFGRPIFPFAYFVFPVIFNFCLLTGFYSYVIAVPLFILSFSLAWKIRNRSLFCKFICFNLLGTILFYFHLIPSVFFLLSLISICMAGNGGYKRNFRQLLLLLVTISPCLLNIFFYLTQGSKKDFPNFSYLLSMKRISDLMKDLFSFSTINFSPWQLVPWSVFILLVIVGLYSSLKRIWLTNDIDQEAKGSIKVLTILASTLILIYLVAPYDFGDGAGFNQRFPWVILLILLPLLRLPRTALFLHAGTIIIAGSVTIFFAFNAALLWQENIKIGKFLSGLRADIPKGAFVMAYKTKSSGWARVDTLLHAVSYYGIFKGCVDVGNYEASFDLFPIRFKNGRSSVPPQAQISFAPETIRWTDYPSIHYLIGWEIESKDVAELNNFFHVVWDDRPLTVWRRN